MIDETGHVANLQVVSGPEMLRAAATDAVRSWVYHPYLLNGVATAVDTVVTVNFQLAPRSGGKDIGGSAQDGLSRETPFERTVPDDGEQPKIVTPLAKNMLCDSGPMGERGYHQRVSGGVMQGLLVKQVEPVYPEVSSLGAVVLHVCVDDMGAVERVQVVSRPEVLRDAAGRAVSEWTYRPYLLNGVAVALDTTVTVMFSR